eukprot:2753327-Amphidinium_carterae.2
MGRTNYACLVHDRSRPDSEKERINHIGSLGVLSAARIKLAARAMLRCAKMACVEQSKRRVCSACAQWATRRPSRSRMCTQNSTCAVAPLATFLFELGTSSETLEGSQLLKALYGSTTGAH